ncbi:MAG TPA: sterol desaturase family protein [Thermoanaerobaculia bacterium]|nr:sterol desaturase family protein [Thermoanaerobaculia bacterium]
MKADVPLWISPAVIGGVFIMMWLAEALRPLRVRVEPRLRHTIRNLSTGGISLALLTLLQAPVLVPVAQWAERYGIGMVRWLGLPKPWNVIVAIILLDYTLWWWHWASHMVPVLWRFHLVHHVDLDLDSSTALRFHFGELALSILYRAVQIAVIGANPFSVWLWQTILFASILFHHGNLRLPQRFERILNRFVVTPRMHGIHHSDRRKETDSNWSSLLSIWDLLHGTLRLDVPDETITIGVPAYRRPEEVSFARIQLLPLVSQRADWVDGSGSKSSHPPPTG